MVVVLLLLVLIPVSGWAQLTAEQAVSIRQIQEPRFSPDGSRVAFTVVEPPKGNGNDRNVWIVDTKSGEVIQFTKSPKSDSSPRWSPDGKKLAFLSDRDGTMQIYIFSIVGGEPSVLTDAKNAV